MRAGGLSPGTNDHHVPMAYGAGNRVIDASHQDFVNAQEFPAVVPCSFFVQESLNSCSGFAQIQCFLGLPFSADVMNGLRLEDQTCFANGKRVSFNRIATE